ncbi:hypothetical protein DPMN_123179 [Dreissena polymorpha]|uniref:Uncharacterized protein n=1 Tax=Dreissena polymorpha TaxID=45954 RepID=A0A9D4GTU0_DREPO|nr:hypothetical protein DPMN_123179 [Dreissena polymorpha]
MPLITNMSYTLTGDAASPKGVVDGQGMPLASKISQTFTEDVANHKDFVDFHR